MVQIYRTEARLHRADRCLFIPMEQLDFSGQNGFDVVERFRGALLAAAPIWLMLAFARDPNVD